MSAWGQDSPVYRGYTDGYPGSERVVVYRSSEDPYHLVHIPQHSDGVGWAGSSARADLALSLVVDYAVGRLQPEDVTVERCALLAQRFARVVDLAVLPRVRRWPADRGWELSGAVLRLLWTAVGEEYPHVHR